MVNGDGDIRLNERENEIDTFYMINGDKHTIE